MSGLPLDKSLTGTKCADPVKAKINESNFQIYPLCDLGTSVQGAMFLYLQ